MLGGWIVVELAEMRLQAISRMRSTATVTRLVGSGYSPTAGAEVQSWSTVWTGPCRVRPAGRAATTVAAGEQQVPLWSAVVSLPWGSVTLLVGDRISVAGDGVYEVVGVERGQDLTAVRAQCDRIGG